MKDTVPYIVPAVDHYYTEVVEGEFIPDQNVLRITWISDAPSDNDLKTYISARFPLLKDRRVFKIFRDEAWHFNSEGSPYGLIFIFYRDLLADC